MAVRASAATIYTLVFHPPRLLPSKRVVLAYQVDTDAIGLKVKHEFGVKQKGRGGKKPRTSLVAPSRVSTSPEFVGWTVHGTIQSTFS
jgi:hypothetical protein